jgi:hypothetical protein
VLWLDGVVACGVGGICCCCCYDSSNCMRGGVGYRRGGAGDMGGCTSAR